LIGSRCSWSGEWGWSRDGCIRWESTCPKGKRRFGGFFVPIGLNGVFLNRNVFDSWKKLAVFPYRQYIIDALPVALPTASKH